MVAYDFISCTRSAARDKLLRPRQAARGVPPAEFQIPFYKMVWKCTLVFVFFVGTRGILSGFFILQGVRVLRISRFDVVVDLLRRRVRRTI